MKTRNWKKSTWSMRNPRQTPTPWGEEENPGTAEGRRNPEEGGICAEPKAMNTVRDTKNQSAAMRRIPRDEEDTVRDEMRRLLKADRAIYSRKIGKDCKYALPPFRDFARPFRLQEHLGKYHIEEYNSCASGRKQLRAICALYANDRMSSKHDAIFSRSPNYIRRSDAIIRLDTLRGNLYVVSCFSIPNLIGRDIRLVQYSNGADCRTLNYARDAAGGYRKLGFGYSSAGFYNESPRIALGTEGGHEQSQEQAAGLCANALSPPQPKFLLAWGAILCDIFLVCDENAPFYFSRDGASRRRI